MAIPAAIVGVAFIAALVAAFEMATEGRGTAHLDSRHDAPLRHGQRRAMLLSISFSVAAEHVRHFQLRTFHGLNAQKWPEGVRWGATETGCGRRSSGLEVEQTLLVAIRRYRAVVARLRWPSSSWMVRTSVPDSSKWTANAWRMEWGVIGLRMPESRRAFWQANSTELLSIGWPLTSPSNSQPFGR